MKVTVALLFVMVTGAIGITPALGQTNDRRTYQRDVPPSNYLPKTRTNEICLWNKVKKRSECHSRGEWRKIAAELGAQQARQENAVDSR